MPSPAWPHDEAHLQQHPTSSSSCCCVSCVQLGRSSKILGLLAALLLVGIVICVHYSGFVHDFNQVPKGDWFKSDIPLTVFAVCQCVVLRRYSRGC